MNKSLGFLVFLVVIGGLTYLEVPAWHGGQSAVVMAPPAETAPAAAAAAADNTPAAPAAAPADTTVATANPTVSEPAPAATVPPTFDVVRVEPSGDATAAGQAEPGSKVEVLDGAAPIATAKADQSGDWALTLNKPLDPGSHDLALRTTSKDQTVATLSDQRVTVSVPEKGSKDVLVVLSDPNAPSKVLEVPKGAGNDTKVAKLEPPAPAVVVGPPPPTATTEPPTPVPTAQPPAAAESPAPAAAAQPPASAAAEPPVVAEPPVEAEPPIKAEPPVAAEPQVAAEPPVATTAPEPAPTTPPPPTPQVVVGAVEADTAGSIYVGGTAATGETVRVYLDDKPLGDSTPTAAGTWLVQTKRDLPAGSYTVRVDQVDSDGKVIARSEVPFEREVEVAELKPATSGGAGEAGAAASGQVTMETVVIKRGDNLWRIARGAWGQGMHWSTIYQANTDQIRNPHWIYPGQVFIMPKGDATWTD